VEKFLEGNLHFLSCFIEGAAFFEIFTEAAESNFESLLTGEHGVHFLAKLHDFKAEITQMAFHLLHALISVSYGPLCSSFLLD
jgi:hypothetical protein